MEDPKNSDVAAGMDQLSNFYSRDGEDVPADQRDTVREDDMVKQYERMVTGEPVEGESDEDWALSADEIAEMKRVEDGILADEARYQAIENRQNALDAAVKLALASTGAAPTNADNVLGAARKFEAFLTGEEKET